MAIFADKRDGKVTGRWRVELQVNGQRIRKRFDTLDEAKVYEARTKLDMASGIVPPEAKTKIDSKPQVETLEQLCRAVEGHLWAGQSSEKTSHQRLELACRLLGFNRTIESITIADIDRMVKVLRDRETAHGTINRYFSALNVALKWALKRGYRKSPLPELEWQDEDEGRIRWITPAEEETVLGLMARPESLMVFVSIRTGLRRGELLGLKPRDVEPGWVHLWGTGTKSGKGRSIPLSQEVYLALQELFKLGMPTQESLRYQWSVARQAMNLADDEDFVFHACRHTFATRAVQAGVHPRVLQRLMGHANLSTTMRYMQVSDEMLTQAIAQMHGSHEPHIPTIHYHPLGLTVGALQSGENPVNPPIITARKTAKTLGKQVLRKDLGSCGETRGGSSPSARTRPNSR